MSFAEIKKSINSNLNKTLDALITEKSSSLSTGISDNKAILNNSTYGLSALKSAMTGGKVPIVKSVQRGLNTTVGKSTTSENITISNVNVNKSIVIIESRSNYNFESYGVLTSSTVLQLSALGYQSSSNVANSWQVIEFY